MTSQSESLRVGARAAGPSSKPDVTESSDHDVSPPLRDITPVSPPRGHGEGKEGDKREEILPHPQGGSEDTVAQRTIKGGATGGRSATLGTGFDGPGAGGYAPPDENSAVGPNHVMTTVNVTFTIHSKTGSLLYGPYGNSTIFSGFAGPCSTTNDGDAVVRYDRLADRWVFTQFANASSSSGPYYECVAVSTSGDPTGTWNRYAFQFTNFPDYPKLAVWPDAYYISYNMFAGRTFVGPKMCALDRVSMLAGKAATQQCFDVSSSYGAPLPADLDGSTPPPAGAPNMSVSLGTTNTTLAAWRFAVNWVTPASTTFTQLPPIQVAPYSAACGGSSCIAQPGTTNQLDSLADRLMFRLAYRNFGTHESLVVTHAVTSGSIGVRWYELRLVGGAPTLFQQGTYVPDANSRWMSSAAMDRNGGLAVGYAISGTSGGTVYPSVRVTGRLAGDALGVLTQGETQLVAGLGSQTGTLSRWGDYASMNIDPSDDCTFWFTGEYLPASGTFNWSTRVGSFQLPGCSGPAPSDFSVANGATISATVSPGASTPTTVNTITTAGTAQSVGLSATAPLPAGIDVSFSPAAITSGASSTMTVSAALGTPTGTYTIPITATGTSATHSTTLSVKVAGADFTLALQPSSATVSGGSTATTSVQTTSVGGAQTVNLSASGLPTGASASFLPSSVSSGGLSTLTISTSAATTPTGTYPVTVTGTGTTATHTAVYTLVVSGTNVVFNPGFETGTLASWTAAGALNQAVSSPHTGAWADRSGTTSATNGDSKISQTFTVPSGATKVSFWYLVSCADTVSYEWATATLYDFKARKTTTILARICSNGGTWAQVTATVTAGRKYTLTLVSHDDNYASDPTYTLFDDIAVF